MSWLCSRCETINSDTQEICEVCDTEKPYIHYIPDSPKPHLPSQINWRSVFGSIIVFSVCIITTISIVGSHIESRRFANTNPNYKDSSTENSLLSQLPTTISIIKDEVKLTTPLSTPIRTPNTITILSTEKPSTTITSNIIFGQLYKKNMGSGLVGNATQGVWFGTFRHLSLGDELIGKKLHITVESGSNKLRVEIWEGFITQTDRIWWMTHRQVAVSDGTYSKPTIVFDPKLIWQIEPGQYTVLFASHADKIVDYSIKYSISIEADFSIEAD